MKPEPLDLKKVREEVFKYVVGSYSNELEEFFDLTMEEIKQRIKNAVEFYRIYRKYPDFLIQDFPEYEKHIEKLRKKTLTTTEEEFILNDYQRWLLKIAFKDVLKGR